MLRWTICSKQLFLPSLNKVQVSELSIKDQGERQSIPYNCNDSNSKWARCVKARFVWTLEELETILPLIISSAVFRLGRWDTMDAMIVRGLRCFSFRICWQIDIIFDLHCPDPDLRLKTHQILEPSHARKLWIHFHACKCWEPIQRPMLLRCWGMLIVPSLRICTLIVIRWFFEVLCETLHHM